ncbi:MAG: preprotein translocase subunit SecE [Patescibacteria group bacterium]|nr:preprotein translocase subunit SecE [bacterium]MDZ4241007.1 preprotein translocase subunit SecE [Patescibacteria group bacterium]
MSIIDYIKETRGELKHVSWPTRRQVVVFTAIVIIASFATAFFLGFFDFVFSQILGKFVI